MNALRIKYNRSFFTCSFNLGAHLKVVPRTGMMLGGNTISITGPCYKANDNIVIKFDDILINGSFRSELEVTITVPVLNKTGTLPLQLSLDGGNTFDYTGVFTSGECLLVGSFILCTLASQ